MMWGRGVAEAFVNTGHFLFELNGQEDGNLNEDINETLSPERLQYPFVLAVTINTSFIRSIFTRDKQGLPIDAKWVTLIYW